MNRLFFLSLIIFVFIVSLDSCYYDKGDVLGGTCDTTSVTYSNQIRSIIDLNCIECHGQAGSANPKLDTYDEVNVQVQNGAFLGSIKHEQGFSSMPKNSSQLDQCQISKVEIWINEGAQNN